MATVMLVLAGGFAGGFVSGLAGFGTGLMALGFWLYVIDPAAASTLVAVCSVAAQAQTIPAIWHAVEPKRVGPMLMTGLLGVPVGTMLLADIDPVLFRLGIGILLVTYSAFMLLARRPRQFSWGGRPADAAIGFGGGILGGLSGLSGPLPTAWATLRGWPKDEARGVFQVFNLVILAAVVVWHIVSGLMTRELAELIVIAVPGACAGAWLGVKAYLRLSDRRFREVVLYLLGASGLSLMWGSL